MASFWVLTGIFVGYFAMQTGNVTVGVGLDLKKEVFIQEYWDGGIPFYAMANLRKTPVKVSIDEWENRRIGKRLIGPVAIGPNSLTRVNVAAAAENRELVAVTLDDGTLLGLLRGPRNRPAVKDGHITTFDGLNGIGGSRPDLWFTQNKLAYLPGSEIELRLRVPDRIGMIRFSKEQSLASHPAAALTSVTSDSLSVSEDERGFTIDATNSRHVRDSHSITLHIRAPRTGSPVFVTINGRVTTPEGGGFSLTRGIPLTSSADSKSASPTPDP
jgi:hypothetical protein